LTITQPLTVEETAALAQAVASAPARQAIEQAAEASRKSTSEGGAIEHFQTPAEMGQRFAVPQLALRVQGKLALFDDPEVLDYPWALLLFDAAPTADDVSALGVALKVSEGGEIDVDAASGKLSYSFLPDLQRDLGLAYRPEHWDEVRLAAWLCRNLPEPSVTHTAKLAFVSAWLRELLRRPGWTLARANQQKFLIRNRIEQQIRDLRVRAIRKAYQETLFGDDKTAHVATDPAQAFVFHPQAYAPVRDYDGRFGLFEFRKHYHGRVGDFDSKEEFECACQLDMWAQKGRLLFWIRNLVRREGSSFFLQKADGRFYPDFLCALPGGVVLAVEYKGANLWNAAEDDRQIGWLWEEMSEGRCRFVMVKDKRWDGVEARL
jgi:type III restriction enzyme